MIVYAVFINEFNEQQNSYIHMLVAIKFDKEDAQKLVDTLPPEAGPYYIACVVD